VEEREREVVAREKKMRSGGEGARGGCGTRWRAPGPGPVGPRAGLDRGPSRRSTSRTTTKRKQYRESKTKTRRTRDQTQHQTKKYASA
jgi:hypothetical protein